MATFRLHTASSRDLFSGSRTVIKFVSCVHDRSTQNSSFCRAVYRDCMMTVCCTLALLPFSCSGSPLLTEESLRAFRKGCRFLRLGSVVTRDCPLHPTGGATTISIADGLCMFAVHAGCANFGIQSLYLHFLWLCSSLANQADGRHGDVAGKFNTVLDIM